MNIVSGFFDKLYTVKLSLKLSVRRILKWLALGASIHLALTGIEYGWLFFKYFEFYGDLRSISAWAPTTHNKNRLCVALVYPKNFTGEGNVARSVINCLVKKNTRVYACLLSPLFRKSKTKKIKNIQYILNAFLSTKIAIYLPSRLADHCRVQSHAHYISAFNVEDLRVLSERFFKNFSGYLCAGNKQDWLVEGIEMYGHYNDSQESSATQLIFPPSTERTHYQEPAIPKKIFWCGHLWDKTRRVTYKPLFEKLCSKKQVVIYGPEQTWRRKALKSAHSCYKGFVPFKEKKLFIQKIHEAGIALCLHSKAHIRHGTTSARLMEASAAAALIITDNNPFAHKHFGNSVLYIDETKPPLEMYAQIEKHLAWIEQNPKQARAMAWRSHQIFQEKFAMEKLVDNLLKDYKARTSKKTSRKTAHH